MSSFFATGPIPGFLALSMTKTFKSFLAIGLSMELKDKIDFMTFECGQVATKINRSPPNPFKTTPKVAVEGLLKDVGRTNNS